MSTSNGTTRPIAVIVNYPAETGYGGTEAFRASLPSAITVRMPYNFPTSFTYTGGGVYATKQTPILIAATGSDAVGGTVTIYASANPSDTSPSTVCASAVLDASGSATAVCTFPSVGSYYIFLKAKSPANQQQASYIRADAPVNVIGARTFTYTVIGTIDETNGPGAIRYEGRGYNGKLTQHVPGTVNVSVSPSSGLDGSTMRIYYASRSVAESLTLCGSGVISSGAVSVPTCTISTFGTFYLFGSIDADDNIPPVSSAQVTVRDVSDALLISATELTPAIDGTSWFAGYPAYAFYLQLNAVKPLFDLTLGHQTDPYGFVAAFLDGAPGNLIYDTRSAESWAWSMIPSIRPDTPQQPNYPTAGRINMCFSQRTRGTDSALAFSYIRWGYTVQVRPRKLFWYPTGQKQNMINPSIELWGYQTRSFSDGDLLWSGILPIPNVYPNDKFISLAFNNPAVSANTAGWKYYEVQNKGGQWGEMGAFLLQK